VLDGCAGYVHVDCVMDARAFYGDKNLSITLILVMCPVCAHSERLL
jgi:hypothetical protein